MARGGLLLPRRGQFKRRCEFVDLGAQLVEINLLVIPKASLGIAFQPVCIDRGIVLKMFFEGFRKHGDMVHRFLWLLPRSVSGVPSS